MNDETRIQAEGRLKRIAGQVAGIQRMVGEDRYCIDVLLQISAAQAALMEAGRVILAGHVEDCLVDAMKTRESRDRQKKINELLDAFTRFGRFESSHAPEMSGEDLRGEAMAREPRR